MSHGLGVTEILAAKLCAHRMLPHLHRRGTVGVCVTGATAAVAPGTPGPTAPYPKGPNTPVSQYQVPKAIVGVAFGNLYLAIWVLGPSEMLGTFQHQS